MIPDYSVALNFTPCLHRRIVPVTTGGMHYSEGEVWDDICERLLCLDCGEYLTETAIRLRWNGGDPADASINEEDGDVPF